MKWRTTFSILLGCFVVLILIYSSTKNVQAATSPIVVTVIPPKPMNSSSISYAPKNPIYSNSHKIDANSLPYSSNGITPQSVSYRSDAIWSGYEVGSGSGNGFSAVVANFNIPCTSGSIGGSHQEATWVGLGGYFANPLVQGGIALQSNGKFYLFYEIAPNYAPTYSYSSFACKDHIQANVSFNSSACPNESRALIEDLSANTAIDSGCINVKPDIQSAEWIDERPTCPSGGFTQLANFNYISWSDVEISPTGRPFEGIANLVHTQLLMQDANDNYLASPDGLDVSGSNTFTDRWYNYGTDNSC
jgi:hypothetical protein